MGRAVCYAWAALTSYSTLHWDLKLMKETWLLALGLAGILVAVVACGGEEEAAAGKQVQIEVAIDEFSEDNHIARQTEVDVGGTLTVTLGSNPTTGFQWTEQTEISDGAVLRQRRYRVIAPEEGGTPGASSEQEWTFSVLEKGSADVSMDYSRPWEGGEKGVWTFRLTVVAR